ncbi:hypothetical protein [Vibrio algarum]|uniref:Uncharacterized protein n=1 Tax=Vibrio algarum TaxID=3020714 RepID=A0ABT4YZA5_9VIBR|nr:hypothetical protein [Vibrio sp. KJ40-1]MDB1126283.1 hypothetical protein [Vibrio sp. KJ40-1]
MDNKNKAEAIAKSVEKISDSKGLAAIGNSLPLVAMFMFFPLVFFAMKWDGKLHEEKQCYEFREIEKKLYKLNNCTGEMKLVNPEELSK